MDPVADFFFLTLQFFPVSAVTVRGTSGTVGPTPTVGRPVVSGGSKVGSGVPFQRLFLFLFHSRI